MKRTWTRARGLAATACALPVLLFASAGAAGVASTATDDERHPTGHGGPVAAPAPDSPDAGFARDMAVHHQQAVEMSFVVRDLTRDEEVRRLAYDIANTQANQRGMLLGWLDLWGLPKAAPGTAPMAWMTASGSSAGDSGHGENDDRGGHRHRAGSLMPGMATRADLRRLATASGEQAEVLFLRMMTAHHQGGLAMARGCADLCAVPQEKALARKMLDAQRSEAETMAEMLARRNSARHP
ncbi:DUF305 domain-containing protein [Streptomyces sp. SCSIO 30461]|uniref:DUF305 domain-containing protein n=1 Tax=Streptomyces sp. SCSIO 30461 TaxID=3118085 RepID=UPI0030CAA18E